MPRHMPHPKTSPSKPAAKTIAKSKSKPKVKWAKPKEPAAKSPATEALKALQQGGLPEETIAHRVAALVTGSTPSTIAHRVDAEHLSNREIEKQALGAARLLLNAEALVVVPKIHAKIAAKVNDEVTRHHEVIACEIKTVGATAFMKLIPKHRNLHRHVAVLLPEYDAAYVYKQRDSSSTLSGPDGFSWKTSRTPDAENDPRFPDFW